MDTPERGYPQRLFAVLNPVGGNCDPSPVRAALAAHCARSGQDCEIHETTGAKDEDVPARVRDAMAAGAELIVAIGGDGTVSQVGEGVAGSSVPLAVIPTGTANVFAREMGIPLEVEAACALLANFRVRAVDGMVCNEHLYLLHLGIGLSSLMIRDTDRAAKRRFGRWAYVWTAIRTLSGLQPHRFEIQVDGVRHRLHAKQIFIANGGIWGIEAVRLGDHVAPDDGVIDLCILNGRTMLDFAGIGWDFFTGQHHRNRRIRYLAARASIELDCRPRLPVQGDGEIIGHTPIRLTIEPGAVQVAVPSAVKDE
jgi:YegS/Rv2252/BmrU family lipid kinase